MKRVFTVALLLTLIVSFIGASESANEIMQKVMDVQESNSAAMDIRFTLIDSKGEERERRIQTLALTEDGLTSTITVFLSLAKGSSKAAVSVFM
jgi:uncharacterized protein YccT (UPF0319 family)